MIELVWFAVHLARHHMYLCTFLHSRTTSKKIGRPRKDDFGSVVMEDQPKKIGRPRGPDYEERMRKKRLALERKLMQEALSSIQNGENKPKEEVNQMAFSPAVTPVPVQQRRIPVSQNSDLKAIHTCSYCDYKSNRRYDVLRHERNVHMQGQGCHLCDFKAKKKIALKRHLKEVHNTDFKEQNA